MRAKTSAACPVPRMSARNRTLRRRKGNSAHAARMQTHERPLRKEWPLFVLETVASVAVVLGFVGAFHGNAEVIGLLLGKGRELDADLFEVQASDFLVQRL
jgi:hypothetical protein